MFYLVFCLIWLSSNRFYWLWLNGTQFLPGFLLILFIASCRTVSLAMASERVELENKNKRYSPKITTPPSAASGLSQNELLLFFFVLFPVRDGNVHFRWTKRTFHSLWKVRRRNEIFFFCFFFCFYQKRLIRMPKRRRKPVEIRLRDLKFENERVAMETVIGRCIFFFLQKPLIRMQKDVENQWTRRHGNGAQNCFFFTEKKGPVKPKPLTFYFLLIDWFFFFGTTFSCWNRERVAMETACLVNRPHLHHLSGGASAASTPPPPPPPPSASTTPSPSRASPSPAKLGHQRNLSLDFRSMGIILPPLSATIQPHTWVSFVSPLASESLASIHKFNYVLLGLPSCYWVLLSFSGF